MLLFYCGSRNLPARSLAQTVQVGLTGSPSPSDVGPQCTIEVEEALYLAEIVTFLKLLLLQLD